MRCQRCIFSVPSQCQRRALEHTVPEKISVASAGRERAGTWASSAWQGAEMLRTDLSALRGAGGRPSAPTSALPPSPGGFAVCASCTKVLFGGQLYNCFKCHWPSTSDSGTRNHNLGCN